MKKSVLVLGLAALFFVSCGEKKKKEVKREPMMQQPMMQHNTTPETTQTTKEVTTNADGVVDNVALGKKLFTEKTCATCHQPDVKVIGPSIKDINKIYTEKNGDIVKFLKEESEAIVDTDPGQVAIMKANLDGFVKDLKGEELAALAAYMRSVK
ncbi:c-type cytochrome [Lutibacter sp.]|uniref:c-type cytochrome n=1 Tax=Lutibacter sp. TaxID=1925666 RepID=UPI0025C342C8|nr:c-type cytochrome [Lutibacter sp.]MCF6182965.1 c-type cytochrome [Lutibacter sp.]